jgi:hypothetical protein
MPDHQTATVTVTGKITHVFGHRFVVQTSHGAVLADVTPKGLDQFALRVGDDVSLRGETKPSELKVSQFTRDGRTFAIDHKKKPHEHHDHAPAEPRDALKAARAAGYETVGEPRRKPKHFEVLGRRDKQLIELHIELDGHIRKTKPVESHDPKWSEELRAS